MSEWHPIETAPKDGTDFLAFCPASQYVDGGVAVMHFYDHGSIWGGIRISHVSGFEWDFDLMPPTHWMPLPEPPDEHP